MFRVFHSRRYKYIPVMFAYDTCDILSDSFVVSRFASRFPASSCLDKDISHVSEL